MEPYSPPPRPGFLERIGHLWAENPIRLATFAAELWRAPSRARAESRRMTLPSFLYSIARQVGRTALRTLIPVLVFGAVMGLAIGAIVGGFGDIVRTFIDTFALTVIYRLVLPVLVMILLVARVGAAIAGRLTTYSLAYPEGPILLAARTDAVKTDAVKTDAVKTGAERPDSDTATAEPRRYMSGRALLGEVLPLILATTITAGISYYVLALWLMAGYMSDGLPSQLLHVLAPGNWSAFADFIQTKTLGPTLWAGTWWSVGFGFATAYVASALGTAAGERIHTGTADPTDYYDAVWESGTMTLIICAVLIGLTF